MTAPAAWTGAPGGLQAAVFDVDGTLCATRSTTSLIWLRAQQHPAWRHRLWLASLAWRAPLALLADRISRDLADRLIYQQFAGLSESQVRQDAQRCCDSLLLPACFPDALAEMAMHRAAGRQIILLSGNVEHVLRPVAQALGAVLIAQRLSVDGDRLTGAYRPYALLADGPAAHSQTQNKALALECHAEAVGIDLAASYAYGDSINDAGMLAAVGHPVAVNPDRKLRREADRRGWDIREWRRPAADSPSTP